MKKPIKSYTRMNRNELAAATATFDEEFVIDQSREQTANEREQWERAKRKPGRPRRGRGVRIISVSIEKGLLEKTDRLAKKLHMQRTKLIARGLEAILNEEVAVE